MFAPRGANSPPARRSRAIRIHFGGDGGKRQPSGLLPPKVAKRPEGVNRNERRTRPAAAATIEVAGLRPSKPLTAGAGGRPGIASGAVRRGAFLASEGRSKRLRAACRASPAPMAQAVGAGTRLPRQERAHDGHILGYTVPNATRHAIPHHNAHIYPRIYRATHRHKPPPPAPSRVSRILWTLETLTHSEPVQPRPPWRTVGRCSPAPHGAQQGQCSPAPMARAAGAAIRRRLPQAAFLAPFGRSQRSQQRIQAPSVRRKDGLCHSERRAGMGPARKRAATKPIPRTARAAAHGGRTCEPTRSERRPSPYRAQRGRPLTAAARASQHERSTKTPCSD